MTAADPIRCRLRDCWVLADNLRVSCETPGWTDRPVLRAAVIEWVEVAEPHRRQGWFTRLAAGLCADPRFDVVIVEAVQNPVLADALLRRGWECDPGVMDFYRRKAT